MQMITRKQTAWLGLAMPLALALAGSTALGQAPQGQADRSAPIETDITLAQAGTEPGGDSPDHAEGGAFAKGDWVVTAYGSTTLFDDDHGDFYTAHLGAHYHFKDDLSIGLEGVGGYVEPNWTNGVRTEPDEDGIVGGLDLMLRWHFVNEADWSVYLDGGVGLQQASTNFPSDSHFNFRDQLGIGATWRLFDNARLMGGVRYHHQSNAGTSENNDGGDWAQPYVGVMVPF